MHPATANPATAREPATRSPMRSLLGVQVLSTGSFVPDNVITNEQLEAELGFEPGWILRRTGIRQRRHAPPEMATSDMAVEAARRCLNRAGASPQEVDLVLVGTFTPDMPFPSTACLVQDRLGLRAPAMDIQAACAGFMYALITGMQFVATGCSKMALVIGADCNSRILNPKDQRTYPLFGDGAGAVLLTAGGEQQGMLAYTLGADGSGSHLLRRPAGGSRLPAGDPLQPDLHFLQMDGRAVFKWAIGVLGETVGDVVQAAGLGMHEVDHLVLHQANIRILEAAVDDLGIDPAKVFINLDRYGNTSAGSIPLALDEMFSQGRILPGQNLVLSGFGAGLAWGTALLRW